MVTACLSSIGSWVLASAWTKPNGMIISVHVSILISILKTSPQWPNTSQGADSSYSSRADGRGPGRVLQGHNSRELNNANSVR